MRRLLLTAVWRVGNALLGTWSDRVAMLGYDLMRLGNRGRPLPPAETWARQVPPPTLWYPVAVGDCGCQPGTVCCNAACPRAVKVTC